MGAALAAEVRHQGGGAGRGGGLDRGLQPRKAALIAGHGLPGGLRACPGGKGRRVTAAGPLRGPRKGGGCAAAGLAAPAKGTGPPPRPQGCCASRCARRPCRPPLTPETTAAPRNRKSGQATACPGQARAHQGQPILGHDHHNRSLHGLRGIPPCGPAPPTSETGPATSSPATRKGSLCWPTSTNGPQAAATPPVTRIFTPRPRSSTPTGRRPQHPPSLSSAPPWPPTRTTLT